MIEMNNITKSWGSHPVLESINLRIQEGESVGLMGPSGCGKSTLARILMLLEPPDQGEIHYRGQLLNRRNKRQMKEFRREVQYISQHPESFFDPGWRLKKSILEAAAIHHLPAASVQPRLTHLLRQLQLNEAVLDRYPYQVSGGEIQRAALCRALLLEPRLLILDEATSMLDISVQAQILNSLKAIRQSRPLAYLLISHDAEVVDWFADRLLKLNGGELYC